jgi:hypothetical protein
MATKTKVYLSLIGAGLLALAVDSFYFGASAPATSEAGQLNPAENESVPEAKSAARARLAAKPVGTSRLNVPELHFPRNLPAYDPAYELRDVFSRTDADSPGSATGPAGRQKASEDVALSTIGREAFQARHRVDAVMVQESLKIAVVDGRWIRVGDMVDRCKLTRIDGESVIFECHDGDTELSPSGKKRHPAG